MRLRVIGPKFESKQQQKELVNTTNMYSINSRGKSETKTTQAYITQNFKFFFFKIKILF